jgi:queuosine biosynthesis protein QueC
MSASAARPAAVVLLSGGMDSAVVLAHLRHEGFDCHALSFDFGQRHRVELERATEVAKALGAASHRVATIDLRIFGASALTADIAVPKGRDVEHAHDIPVTYVPARNTIFLAHALAMAESLGARDLGIGVNAIDYSGYPDCRPGFVEAYARRRRGRRAGRALDPRAHAAPAAHQGRDHPPRPRAGRGPVPDGQLLRPRPHGRPLRHLRCLPAAGTRFPRGWLRVVPGRA